ncbi:hypothetical protein N7532_007300 [Penicillium argentinense]|uniref:Uncharacterized protein n=1 Tax=Penicillium argentinense TaxID=1131581 RepID=A0A9W9K6M1_9EURO|nr:uncharacterized protein N7532_007300 [Penicillium argentinense]KAJ5095009.1 hypothetical protein N7532_007300 [Penicillium argentinense]
MVSTPLLGPFKVAVLGDAGVGKRSLISQKREGKFNLEYMPTIGYEICPLPWTTNHGTIILDLCDISGSYCDIGMRTDCLRDAHAAVIVVDRSEQQTVDNALYWYREFVSVTGPDTPFLVCSTKRCLAQYASDAHPDVIDWPAEMGNVTYFHISSDEEGMEFPLDDRPFSNLFTALTNLPDIVLATVCGIPYQVPELLEKYRREMEEAASRPIPDPSDDENL